MEFPADGKEPEGVATISVRMMLPVADARTLLFQ
jgi:hypothetical protein